MRELPILGIFIILAAIFTALYLSKHKVTEEKPYIYPGVSLVKPKMETKLEYSFEEVENVSEEYELPLKEIPENYERDIVERMGITLSDEQIQTLLNNGVLIVPAGEYEKFEDAYRDLSYRDVPNIYHYRLYPASLSHRI